MLVDPAVMFRRAAQERCIDAAHWIVDFIEQSPLTPERQPEYQYPGYTPNLRYSYKPRANDATGGADVIATARYWKYVEYGTGHGPEQAHVRPAIEAYRATHGGSLHIEVADR